MPRTDVLLATCAEWSGLIDDDVRIVAALADRGISAAPAVWNDPTVDWSSARAVVLRSVFDYTSHPDEFLDWIERTAAVTEVHNPPGLVRWNSHKSYLRELESAGIPIVPTEWVGAGSRTSLAAILDARGWTDSVVKPTIGNGARGAMRVSAGTHEPGRAHFDALTARHDVMVQPYLSATENPGENALIHFRGCFSHAIRKDQMLAGRPFSMDRIWAVEPDPRELELARRVLDLIPAKVPLYARVDTLVDGEVVCLMELEVIEPVLFLSKSPGAAERFAAAIAGRLE